MKNDQEVNMETVDAIFSRRSIRRYTGQPISDQQINTLLRAAMASPSSVGNKDWAFVVIRGQKGKEIIMKSKPGNAEMLRTAPVAIMVCGDKNLFYAGNPDYWVQDCAAATQNILIAATGMGLGSVWLGIWPNSKRSQVLQKEFSLPDSLIPFSAVAIGYPDETKQNHTGYEKEKVFFERYDS